MNYFDLVAKMQNLDAFALTQMAASDLQGKVQMLQRLLWARWVFNLDYGCNAKKRCRMSHRAAALVPIGDEPLTNTLSHPQKSVSVSREPKLYPL